MTHVSKTTRSVSAKEIQRSWHLIDANGKVLGRIVTEIASFLQGKHKVENVPYLDMGDNVVVVNATGVRLTGRKEQSKVYQSYSGYPGGRKETSFKSLRKENAPEIIRQAVSGMLAKNKHRDARLARLFVYEGSEHPHKKIQFT